MSEETIVKAGETLDDLLHGELKLLQRRSGYRYSVDALLLAHFALPVVKGERVLDLGTGSGVVALILAQRGRPARVVGVELQPGLADLARRNAQLNPTVPRVEIVAAEATEYLAAAEPGSFGVIVTNPPFHPAGSGQVSPRTEKALAKHELRMKLGEWLKAGRRLIGGTGRICLIYPVDQEERLMRSIRGLSFSIARRTYAVSRPAGPRKFVLLDLQLRPASTRELPEIPIQTPEGKFSLDGYK